ncbi:MAG: class I SAM-dependent methyltransferase [Candidatus Syntropharchaeia archaeon]
MRGWEKLRERLNLNPEEEKRLPRGWQIVGDIIIIRLDGLENKKYEIGRILLEMHPRCTTVVMNRGIHGRHRIPDVEVIIGDKTETIHKENGCKFKLDVSKIMLSQGNLNERIRMSRVGKGEVVVDMFAGIGYFSIPMAVHSKPEKIISIEENPVAFYYLKENIKLNGVEGIIHPVNGDCGKVTPEGIADRVIMGYLDGKVYLRKGIDALKKGGVIHYHEATPLIKRPVKRVEDAAESSGREAEILKINKIKKYAPGVWHVVVDARIF